MTDSEYIFLQKGNTDRTSVNTCTGNQ